MIRLTPRGSWPGTVEEEGSRDGTWCCESKTPVIPEGLRCPEAAESTYLTGPIVPLFWANSGSYSPRSPSKSKGRCTGCPKGMQTPTRVAWRRLVHRGFQHTRPGVRWRTGGSSTKAEPTHRTGISPSAAPSKTVQGSYWSRPRRTGPELSTAGKLLRSDASQNSHQNHAHIGAAIDEACAAWRRTDPRVTISRDTHYQLANRLAFTWKLASLGISVVLLYLGFTGDEGIRDAGKPFADDADWRRAFGYYVEHSFPVDLVGGRFEFGETPAWVLSRSRGVCCPSRRRLVS